MKTFLIVLALIVLILTYHTMAGREETSALIIEGDCERVDVSDGAMFFCYTDGLSVKEAI